MKIKKPYFWDLKKPNFLSYFLLPLTIPIALNNFLSSLNKKKEFYNNIKTICVGNIYVGGTGKTPLTIKLSQILEGLNYKTGVVKKFYKDQNDEQRLIKKKINLYCSKKRKIALDMAIKNKVEIAIFDDGLQDKSINYNLKFVCFNNAKGIGNGFLLPAGPLREKVNSMSKYDAIFINGTQRNNNNLKKFLKKFNKNIKIFETFYQPTNINEFNNKDKYLIFSGIGNPDTFKEILTQNNFNISKDIRFPDHYQYNKNDINKIKVYAKNSGSKILTTEKDYIKLNKKEAKEINYLSVDLLIKNENELINFIESRI
jgi:tetraacyldisaccharide 4'-kinase